MSFERASELIEVPWKPEAPKVAANELMKPTRTSTADEELLERMYVLSASEALDKLKTVTDVPPHIKLYIKLLSDDYEKYSKPGFELVPDAHELVTLTSEGRQKAIAEIRESTKNTPLFPAIEAAWRVSSNIVDIAEGRLDFLKLLLPDLLLPRFHEWANDRTELGPLFSTLAKSKPGLKVLEIGSGFGGTTTRALKGFKSEEGKGYDSYTWTDINPMFVKTAEQRFAANEAMDFRLLDIGKDPKEQGFEEGAYDLILASNVLHAVPRLDDTLEYTRKLLKPDGVLFLQEMCPPGKYLDFIVALHPVWWIGVQDARPNGARISVDEWETRLRKAGFSGIDALVLDNRPPWYYNANMLTRPSA
ncbi:S-adenosyl-L-methionine-dependent methyltransferase [Stachybotrys elegans]|uniref:S-adenosyl-L-methionine-dependent methyltransferase n=1 Tax=Stachybotrys elegans TaxID=80388 RepID=A0A8K0SMX7_9HYPO|nr:S-adenosyl-L-methionine-dependent methyltransferase [Stachybotrys elegans]